MKPSKIPPGTKLIIKNTLGPDSNVAFFIKRYPAQSGRKPFSLLRFPAFAGLNGSDDKGICQMSDYDLSRRGQMA